MDKINRSPLARRERDTADKIHAYEALSDALKRKNTAASNSQTGDRDNAIAQILQYYHLPLTEDLSNSKDRPEDLFLRLGLVPRRVGLDGKWYRDASGAYLCRLTNGRYAAAVPKMRHYEYIDPDTGTAVRINKKTVSNLRSDATSFCLPLPEGHLSVKDLFSYMARSLSIWDVLPAVLASLMASVIAMTMPAMTRLVFSSVIPSGMLRFILPITALLICSSLASWLVSMVGSLATSTIGTRVCISLQAASMYRVMRMPATFFRNRSSGELADQLSAIDSLSAAAVDAFFSLGLSSVFSILYVFQIHRFAPVLVIPSLIVLAVKSILSFVCMRINAKLADERMKKQGKLSGMLLTVLSSIQKIRLIGAENRIYARWTRQYAEVARLYNLPRLLLFSPALSEFVSMVGIMVIWFAAANGGLTTADYMAFTSAFGLVSGAFSSLLYISETVAGFKPMLNMMKPILDNEPESERDKLVLDKLSGSISASNICFRYQAEGQPVLRDVSLDIKPGEYVALVGGSGSGKSTLMRILLGFEKPESGEVWYDQKPLSTLNLRLLRRKIGTVLQNGQLMQGTVFSNIAVGSPGITEKDAWEAAEAADIADDIREMPMGMQTMLSENGGGISGGQRQRLLIARALAGKPSILFLDEATSALDNLAQAKVCKALDELKCTRIVIAHRLSTIRQCSRILYLENGVIAESGTYDALIALNGRFAELVAKQRL